MNEEKPKTFKLQKTVSTRQHGWTALISLILGILFYSSVIGVILLAVGIISGIIWAFRISREPKKEKPKTEIVEDKLIEKDKPHPDKNKKQTTLSTKIVALAVGLAVLVTIILIIAGNMRSKSDYNNCVSTFRASSYTGRTADSQNIVAQNNQNNSESYKGVCSDIYQGQLGISYLFNSDQRKQSITRYCDDFSREIGRNSDSWSANPVSKVLFGEIKYDYNQSYNQCLHQFGF